MKLEDVRGRVLLDTCLVNFVLDHGEQIHEGVAPASGTAERVAADIDALYNIFVMGRRAHWQLAVSPHAYHEVLRTANPQRRRQLEGWFQEIWQYLVRRDPPQRRLADIHRSRAHPREHSRERSIERSTRPLRPRPHSRCRRLQVRSVLHPRLVDDPSSPKRARRVAIEIVTPVEWWTRIQPYAALFV